jgi:hypothetical protein
MLSPASAGRKTGAGVPAYNRARTIKKPNVII